jgi:hypothetical protein
VHRFGPYALLTALLLDAVAGCEPAAGPPSQAQAPAGATSAPRPTAARQPEVSWDSDRDRTFAEFLRKNSGGMIAKAAVGIERKGTLRIELSSATAPEDALDLTRSILAGARKDFPERPITLSLYDPNGEPILKASRRPGEHVRYQIAHQAVPAGESASGATGEAKDRDATSSDALAYRGVTRHDRRFAQWAETKGRDFLRYVEADLERHGRLWFGVSRNVAPDDVRTLTQSLLEGARTEFPDRELRATVFDPDGERIGTAQLDRSGRVDWTR